MTALQTGCRLIDTAACCGNKRAAGEAVRESEIAREERLLTHKIWIRDAGYGRTRRSFFAKTREDGRSGPVSDPHALRGLPQHPI